MTDHSLLTRHDLPLATAQRLLAKGLEIAAGHKAALALALVDRSGHLLAFARMDDAAIVTIKVAIGKARTAAWLKAPSKLFEDMIDAGKAAMTTVPGLVPLQGGVPLVIDGAIVGAVGVSGSTGEGDEAIAQAISQAL